MTESDVLENTVTFQTFDKYHKDNRSLINDGDDRLTYDVIGLSSEVGEVSSEIKKLLCGYQPSIEEFEENVLLECGDVLGYLSRLLDDLGLTLEEAAKANIEKLNNRMKYGKGKYGKRS